MSLVENERIKLAASALNTLATASITLGVLAPGAAIFYGFSATSLSLAAVILSMSIWLVLGGVLHFSANRLLGRLRP